MPTIPFNPLPTERPAGPPGAYQNSNANPGAFGAYTGAALSKVGGDLEQGGDVAAQNAVRLQTQANQTNAQDVYANSFSPNFRAMYQKYYSLQGKDALDQMPDFQAKMNDYRKEVSNGLPNQAQRLLFDDISRRRIEAELDGMSRYADQQNKVWQDQTHLSTLKNYSDQAADKYNDEHAFGTALGSGQAEIDRYAMATGKSAEWARAAANDFVGVTSVQRLQRWMVDDPVKAQQWYRDNSDIIPPAQRASVEHALKTVTEPIEAANIVDQTMTGAPLPDITKAIEIGGEPMANLVGRVINAESGGNQAAVSPKGAIGVMQLMPTTARDVATKMGVPYDFQKLSTNPEYNKALGTEYLRQMLSRYGQNQTLAVAAYNAGPGAVDKWLTKNGDPNKGEISSEEWASKIPYKETRDYVSKINAGAPPTAGTVPTSNDPRAHLQDWMREAELRAEAVRPGDPVFRDRVLTELSGRVNKVVGGQEGLIRDAHRTAISLAAGLDGGQKPLTISDLFNNPQMRQKLPYLDPSALSGLNGMLRANQKEANGEFSKSDAKLVHDLRNRIYLDDGNPDKITSTAQLTQYMDRINYTDHEHLTKEIGEAGNPETHPFLKQTNEIKNTAYKMLTANNFMAADTNTSVLSFEASHRFDLDVDNRIKAYRAAGKNPSDLFDPTNKDYVLAPQRVMSFMPSEQDIMAAKAKGGFPAAPAAPGAAPAPKYPTATNPTTGAKIILKDGQWQPLTK